MRALSQGHKEERVWRLAVCEIPTVSCIADNADDLKGRAIAGQVKAEVRADRVFTGLEKLMNEGFIDDNDVACRCGILLSDGTAADNFLSHSFQITRAHVIPRRASVLIVHVGHCMALANDEFAPIVLQWRV